MAMVQAEHGGERYRVLFHHKALKRGGWRCTAEVVRGRGDGSLVIGWGIAQCRSDDRPAFTKDFGRRLAMTRALDPRKCETAAELPRPLRAALWRSYERALDSGVKPEAVQHALGVLAAKVEGGFPGIRFLARDVRRWRARVARRAASA